MANRSDVLKVFSILQGMGARNAPDLSTVRGSNGELSSAERLADLWLLVLEDVSGEDLQAAAVRCSQESPFWPHPSEIRKHCRSVQRATLALEVADPTTGRDRWAEVLQHAGSIGARRPDWLEELAERMGIQDQERLGAAIRDCGGWKAICLAENDYARSQMGRRFAAAWDRQARAGLLQGAPQRALEGSRGDVAAPIDLAAEVARRKALGGSHGPR